MRGLSWRSPDADARRRISRRENRLKTRRFAFEAAELRGNVISSIEFVERGWLRAICRSVFAPGFARRPSRSFAGRSISPRDAIAPWYRFAYVVSQGMVTDVKE